MAVIDFPSNVPLNYEFISGSNTWVWDGTTWNAKTSSLLFNPNPSQGTSYYNEFYYPPSTSNDALLFTGGTGATISSLATSGNSNPGVVQLNITGSSVRTTILSASQKNLITVNHGIGKTICESSVSFPTLSTSPSTYQGIFGLINATAVGTQTTGIYFIYDSAGTITGTASLNWQVCIQNSSSNTFVTTTTPVSANTFYKLRIDVISNTISGTPGDSSSTSSNVVNFYINDTLVATPSTTNMPTGYGPVSPGFYFSKVASSFTGLMNIDYLFFEQKFNDTLYR
jgi:hypothetical protein